MEAALHERRKGAGLAHLRSQFGQPICLCLHPKESEKIRGCLLGSHPHFPQPVVYLCGEPCWAIRGGEAAAVPEEAEDWQKGKLSYFDDEAKKRYNPVSVQAW